jgi:bifunctional oligoribonuclease and PAP phosphatase NrnA
MKKTALLRDAWKRLIENHSFILACHENPDGDALGSALALAHVLRQQGKDVTVVCEGGLAENYRFIPEQETLMESTDRRDFDVGVLIDCEGLKRAGSAADVVAGAQIGACVDHHIPDDEFGQIRVVDQKASSTAELVVRLLDANDVPVDEVAATQLMTGLINDTGGFRFGNTKAETFRVAARLTELGASPSAIAREVYETRSAKALKLLGRTLGSLQVAAGGEVVWSVIRKRDLEELGCQDADTDGVVNFLGYAKGARVAALFRELGDAEVRVSLRSRDGFDVNRVARAFDGGGHVAAAGCTLNMPLDQARDAVLGEVLKWTES